MLYDREIDPRLERSRFANALTYLDETQNGIRSYKVEFEIDNDAEPTLIYDLKRKDTSEHIVSDTAGNLITGWTISEGTGPASSDQIVWTDTTLPPDETQVQVQYKKIGQPDGDVFGRRDPVEIDEETEVFTYESVGYEKLHHVAGFLSVYNDPAWYWVFVDANPGLNGIWLASVQGLPLGTQIQYPSEADVLIQLESLLDE